MNFSKEELNILKTLTSIECEISKHNLENRGRYFQRIFYRTGNRFYNDLCQGIRVKEFLLDCMKEALKEIGNNSK